jgi:hypothetical protein
VEWTIGASSLRRLTAHKIDTLAKKYFPLGWQ